MNLKQIAALNLTLPANADGKIVSPRYVPPGSPYLAKWREYLKAKAPAERPWWLVEDLKFMKLGR